MIKYASLDRPRNILFISVILLSMIAAVWHVTSLRMTDKKPGAFEGSYHVVLRADANDIDLTGVYLRNIESGVVTAFVTLTDVNTQHYHPAGFVDGNLYILKQLGIDNDGTVHPDWTDELWKYASVGRGTRLYSAKGLDFRTSPDKKIMIVVGGYPNETLVLANLDGEVLKTFGRSDVGVTDTMSALEPLFWDDNTLWLRTNQGQQMMGLISFNAGDFTYQKYDLSPLRVTIGEVALETMSKTLVASTYISPLEAIDNLPKQNVSLFLYELATGKKTQLLFATTSHSLEPKWIDASTIEYQDPNGAGRTRLKVR